MYVDNVKINWNKKFKNIKLRDPILIVGLPGIGNVGKLVVEHLRLSFKAKRIATLYSKRLPAVIFMKKNGKFRLASIRFYLLGSGAKHDILLLTGDAQPPTNEGQYEINNEIFKFFKNKLNGRLIYTLAGYNTNRELQKEAKVFGIGTSEKIMKDLKKDGVVFGEAKGFVYGTSAMLLAIAKMNKIDAACIMGETSMMEVDAVASKAVLKVLAKNLYLKINMKDIDKLIEDTAKAVKEIEKQAGVQQIVQ
ncbi:MAG: PAC2 family protein, partial [Candidatus Micrarchaeia archaeon]